MADEMSEVQVDKALAGEVSAMLQEQLAPYLRRDRASAIAGMLHATMNLAREQSEGDEVAAMRLLQAWARTSAKMLVPRKKSSRIIMNG